jgi:hypothetical protein
MGPIDSSGASNVNDYYPGKGSIGPTILPASTTGWWYLTN